MNTRNWPIRSKIIALVAAPLAALLALWIFATTLTVGPALNLLAAQKLLDEVQRPGHALISQLQQERRVSLVYLAGRGEVAALRDQRARTDQAVADFRRRASSGDLRDRAGDLLNTRLDQLFTALDILPSGRGFIDRREMDKSGALGLYTSVIEAAFRTFAAMATLPDESLNREARALTALGRAREMLGQGDALLAGILAAGRFAEGEHGQLVQIIGAQRFLYASAVADLSDADRATYQRLSEGDAFVRLRAMEEDLVAKGRAGAAPPVNAGAWQSSYDSAQQQLRDFELAAADSLAERTTPVAVGILVRLGLAGVVGLAALMISVVIALRVGRSLVRRLTGLRAAALEMAGDRLPALVGRLGRGEDVDVAAETPPLEFGDDEIGEVGKAFNEVQRTAVRSAVDEASLRRGLKDVYLNIARRSQTLLHRQLALLDRMERRATEPEELEDLFRIDHMATRMRRHAEDLVILAGAAPGRGWRNPVPMIDVIRGAVSEVEDYARVDIQTVQPAATVGRAVGDVIHLLAELIENAASFSPPHTEVAVVGQMVANGYAIEIEDRGLGMTPEAIDEANHHLANQPDFDPANSARLGLFVVAQLSARHGVRVRLRPSPYGGVTAVALVPSDLVVTGTGVLALPGRAGSPGAPEPSAPPPLPAGAGAPPDRHSSAVLLPTEPPTRPRAEPDRPARAGHRLAAVPTQRFTASAAGPLLEGTVAPGPAASQAASDPVPDRSAASAMLARTAELPVGDDGLPRRVRQTSLAPQLREPGPRTGGHAAVVNLPAPRTPEQVRAAMSALQAGTARGRQAGATAPPDSDAALGGTDVAGTDVAGIDAAGSDRPGTDHPGTGPGPAESAMTEDSFPATDRDSTESGRGA